MVRRFLRQREDATTRNELEFKNKTLTPNLISDLTRIGSRSCPTRSSPFVRVYLNRAKIGSTSDGAEEAALVDKGTLPVRECSIDGLAPGQEQVRPRETAILAKRSEAWIPVKRTNAGSPVADPNVAELGQGAILLHLDGDVSHRVSEHDGIADDRLGVDENPCTKREGGQC